MADSQKIWQVAQKSRGRPRKIKNGDELWEKFIEYCSWVDSNPWQVKGTTTSMSEDDGETRRAARQDTKMLQRPYTLYGFCAYCGVCKWADFKNSHKADDDFLEVIMQIEAIISSYQIEGAMLRQFEPNIVSRLNGLADIQVSRISLDGSIPTLNEEDIAAIKKINGLS